MLDYHDAKQEFIRLGIFKRACYEFGVLDTFQFQFCFSMAINVFMGPAAPTGDDRRPRCPVRILKYDVDVGTVNDNTELITTLTLTCYDGRRRSNG